MNRRPDRHGVTPRSKRARLGVVALAASAVVLLSGCFDAPKTEDRWTRVDILGGNVSQNQAMTLGASESIYVSTNVTFRSIVTGFAIADLRVSPNTGAGAVHIAPDAKREPMAVSIDSLLANSYSVGRATRAITGWDHLIQRIDFGFRGTVPDTLSASGGGGLFLLIYLGAGDKMERLGQPDTLIVTPFHSADYQILPVGMTFQPVAP